MRFKYSAYDAAGKEITGVLQADSEERAEQTLWQADMTVLSLKKEREPITLGELAPTLFGVKRRDLIIFSRDLATLLRSGIALRLALRMLQSQTRKAVFRKVQSQIIEDIEVGSSLSQACARFPNVFPPLYQRLLQIGEEIGNLELVLQQLTIYMEKEEAVVSKVQRSLAYPLFVLTIALASIFILINVVLPAITRLLREFGGQLPLATRILIAVTGWLQDYFRVVIIGVFVLAVLFFWYMRTPSGRRRRDLFLLRVPVVGSVILKGNVSRMARTMFVLLKAGVSLTETLNLIIQTSQNTALKESLTEVRADVHQGHLLSKAMSTRPLFPAMLTQMIAVGEETGKLESNLESLASLYEEEMDREVSRLVAMVEPAMIIMVGGLVGFIAVSLISPIYTLIKQVK